MIAGRIWPKLIVPYWNTLLNAASSGRRAFKIYIVLKNLKIFILDSRYVAKPSFSSAGLIACMMGTKFSYTPSTTLLVDSSQCVLQVFCTFFTTTYLAFSDSFILCHDSCAFTKRAVRLGNLAKNFQSCKRTPLTCVMCFFSSLAPAQARASLWQTQCTLISLLLKMLHVFKPKHLERCVKWLKLLVDHLFFSQPVYQHKCIL